MWKLEQCTHVLNMEYAFPLFIILCSILGRYLSICDASLQNVSPEETLFATRSKLIELAVTSEPTRCGARPVSNHCYSIFQRDALSDLFLLFVHAGILKCLGSDYSKKPYGNQMDI
jgi:hypothetical protein